MKPRMRRLPVVIVAAVAATVITAVPATAAAPGGDIDWQPCEGAEQDETVSCATITVPLDYSDPDGDTIKVGLARRQALNPDERIGSILMDPGGPGGSGVDVVRDYPQLFSDEVQQRFDVVGFDPRGINTSTQVTCDAELAEELAQTPPPTNQAEFAAREKLNADIAENCRKLTGPLYDNVDTKSVVQDMDRIRAALGEEKLTYLGYSYGTLMGQQYAEMFPDKIRAMVLDGNMDHSLSTTWDFMSTETAAVERNFTQFAQWCDTTADCALNGSDTLATYDKLREKAKKGKLTDPETGDPIDFYTLSDLVFNANFPQSWPDLADYLEALRAGKPLPTVTGLKTAEPVNTAETAIWCQDWDYPLADYKEWKSLNKRLAKEYPNVQWTNYNMHALSCIGNPDETTNPQAPLDIEGAPPLVMLGNLNDFATVYEWSQAAAEQSGAVLLTYEGYSHTVYSGRTDCIDDPINAYLIDLTVPDEGISCASVDEPGGEQVTTIAPQAFQGA